MKRAVLATAVLLLLIASPLAAQERGFLPNCERTVVGPDGSISTNRQCELEDFIQIFINLADWGLSVIAVTTLFFFAWGAFDWIVAGGRQTWVDSGKKKMVGATIGLLVVLTAWVFVGFYVGALTGNFEGYVFPGKDSQRLWFGQQGSCKETYTQDCKVETGIRNGCGDPQTTEFGDIAQIQLRLQKHQCEVGGVDGCYGDQTEQAVKDWQLANGFEVTGVVDTDTYNELFAGGFPCGFDFEPSLIGCCKPPIPTDKQPCIDSIFENQCEGSLHGDPGTDYNFSAGRCDAGFCGSNICTYDPNTSCK